MACLIFSHVVNHQFWKHRFEDCVPKCQIRFSFVVFLPTEISWFLQHGCWFPNTRLLAGKTYWPWWPRKFTFAPEPCTGMCCIREMNVCKMKDNVQWFQSFQIVHAEWEAFAWSIRAAEQPLLCCCRGREVPVFAVSSGSKQRSNPQPHWCVRKIIRRDNCNDRCPFIALSCTIICSPFAIHNLTFFFSMEYKRKNSPLLKPYD